MTKAERIYTFSQPPHTEFFVMELVSGGIDQQLAGPFPTTEKAEAAAEKFRAEEKQESLPPPKPKRQYKKRAPKVKPATPEEVLFSIREQAARHVAVRVSLFNVWKQYKALTAFAQQVALGNWMVSK